MFFVGDELALDLDLSLARARFTGVAAGEDHVPGALESVVAAGATWSTPEQGPFGAVRLRRFGAQRSKRQQSLRFILIDGCGPG
jgi:hypothetical protein